MHLKTPYSETSNGITIEVAPLFDSERSDPDSEYYLFTYGVKFTNHNDYEVKIQRRYFKIRDGFGESRIVEGEGVVGKRPSIAPGESFSYQSFCPLKTPTGNMRGRYLFEDDLGNLFSAAMPVFFFRVVDVAANIHSIYQPLR